MSEEYRHNTGGPYPMDQREIAVVPNGDGVQVGVGDEEAFVYHNLPRREVEKLAAFLKEFLGE